MEDRSLTKVKFKPFKFIFLFATVYAGYFAINSFILFNDFTNYTISKTQSLDSLKLDTVLFNVVADEMENMSDLRYEKLRNGESVVQYKLGENRKLIYKLPLTVSSVRTITGSSAALTGFYKVRQLSLGIGVDLIYRYKEMSALKDSDNSLAIVSDVNASKDATIIAFQDAEFIDFKFDNRMTLGVRSKNTKSTIHCKIHKLESCFIIEFEA